MSHIFEQNNIAERVQKAIQRFGAEGMKFGVKREKFEAPVDLASDSELAARKRFLLQTSENGEAARVAYERIIRGNDLQDVNYLARGSRASKSIGRVWIRQPSGSLYGFGTGFLIGRNILLTNNHVLENADWADRSEVEFEFERDIDRNELRGVKFSFEPKTLFYTNKELDFTVVAVKPKSQNADRDLSEFGSLPLISGPGKALEGEWLSIIQHPGGERKQVCARENQLLKRGDDVLWYSTDTEGGSSGSPVFNNDWVVVALHHSGVPEVKDGRWQTIGGHDYDEQIHGEEDIKWVANEGIRVTRIVDSLKRDLGTHSLIKALFDLQHSELSNRPSTIRLSLKMNDPIPTTMPVPRENSRRKFLLSFDDAGNPTISPLKEDFWSEAVTRTKPTKPKIVPKNDPKGIPFKFDDDYSNRKGYDATFLSKTGDKGKFRVNLPQLTPALAASAVKLLEPDGTKEYVLKYTGMSLVMHMRRRFAIYSAANVDFSGRWSSLSSKRTWKFDPRIPLEAQVGPENYERNQFDKGHLTRQEDMEYGETVQQALQSTADTCHWTNCTLQHAKFNRTQEWWQGMEKHILEHSIFPDAKSFRAQVITGPIFSDRDPVFQVLPGIQVPMKFWKIAAAVTGSGKLFAVAYLLDQTPVIDQFGVTEAVGDVPFEPYKLFQLPISELEEMIHLKFTYGPNSKPLSECDPLENAPLPELDANQNGIDDRRENAFAGYDPMPNTWIDMTMNAPYFGKK